MREFLTELHKFAEARGTMNSCLAEAVEYLSTALTVDGPEALASAALACRYPYVLHVQKQNIWGTEVADVTSDYAVRAARDRGYATSGVSVRIDETVERFEQTVELIIEIAPAAAKLRLLAEDIRKTSRRVNALEQRLLVELKAQVRFIRNALDQREREDIFRLKRLKRKNSRQK